MKKTDTLEIYFQGFETFEYEVRAALAKKKPLIQPKNKIYFESVSTFRSFMTIQKIEILTVIATHKPRTIYELAKAVDRDFAAVFRDCVSLESTGFIKLRDLKDTKGSRRPALVFPYKRIAVHLPHSPYAIAFEDAA